MGLDSEAASTSAGPCPACASAPDDEASDSVQAGSTSSRICRATAETSPCLASSFVKFRRRLLPAMLVYAMLLLTGVDALKCYCTDDHCEPFGACEGPACLVGILKESNQVIRTCGTRPIGCHKGNVLAQYYGHDAVVYEDFDFEAYWEEDEKWTDLCACDQPFCNTFTYLRSHTRRESNAPAEEQPLIFQRVDRPDDMPHVPDSESAIPKSTMLTSLLVIVPLTVGGAAIAVVAFNYYCHLC